MRHLLRTALVLLFAIPAFAQSTPDYNGTWILDTQRTKLDGRVQVDSMTLKIKDKVTEITKETITKRGGQPRGQGARGMGAGLGLRDGIETFTMDGKEKTIVEEGPRGPVKVKLRGRRDKEGRVIISTSRNLSVPMGEVQISTEETWSLSSDGQTLTINAKWDSPLGSNSNKLYFIRQ
jgi:hypothetical protein